MVLHDDLTYSFVDKLTVLSELTLYFADFLFDFLQKLVIFFSGTVEVDFIVNFVIGSGFRN